MISFIIIGKNEGWRLEKCLSSVKSIAARELSVPYEVIYVDSQSTDDSIELSKKYADRTFLITGICNAAIGRNIGAKEAKGDILFFLDGDMELCEGAFSTILTDDGKLVYPFVSGIDYDYLYDENWNLKVKKYRRQFKPGVCSWQPTTGGLFVIDRSLWEMVGGMDNRFRRSQDMDFGFMMLKNGYPLKRMGQVWVNHHTKFYAVRKDELIMPKYSALLLRKHFFEKHVQQAVFKINYSSYYLVFCILFAVCMRSLLGLLVFLPYFALIGYRTTSALKRNSAAANILMVVVKRIIKDVILLGAFIGYYPKQPQMSYKNV